MNSPINEYPIILFYVSGVGIEFSAVLPNNPPVENVATSRITRTPFYYGWVILFVAALANFTSAPGQTYTFSVFQDSFIEDLNLSSTTISSLYLFGSLTAAVLIMPIGRNLDRFGPRIMLVLVTFLMGLGAFWISNVDYAWQLYIGFAIMRTMGQGALSLIPATVVSVWFVRRRAFALALMALGGATASGVFPIYGATLIQWSDWRTAWIVLGITAWVLLIIPAAIFMRSSPESVGLEPDDGSTAIEEDKERGNKHRDLTVAGDWLLSQALRGKVMWLLMLAGAAQSMVGTGVMFHQVSIMSSKGMGTAVSAGVFGVVAPSLIAGQFTAGAATTKFKPRYMLAIGQLGIVVSILLLLSVSEIWHAYVYGIFLGINMGFLMNTNQFVWPEYFGRKNLGSIRGVANFATMAAAALGPLPLALSLDLSGSYSIGLFAYLCVPPICGIAALFAGSPKPANAAHSR